VKFKEYFCFGSECTLRDDVFCGRMLCRDAVLVNCRILCATVVGTTSSEGFLVYTQFDVVSILSSKLTKSTGTQINPTPNPMYYLRRPNVTQPPTPATMGMMSVYRVMCPFTSLRDGQAELAWEAGYISSRLTGPQTLPIPVGVLTRLIWSKVDQDQRVTTKPNTVHN